jgi:hypothetical protein
MEPAEEPKKIIFLLRFCCSFCCCSSISVFACFSNCDEYIHLIFTHPCSDMAELDNLLGSLISLITQQDIRYEGVLFSINQNESSIVLRDGEFLVGRLPL